MYWAHSDPNGKQPDEEDALWQSLGTHLQEVGEGAYKIALASGASHEIANRARAAGLLHDLGKYSDAFQRLLLGEVKKAPHSIFGAALAQSLSNATDVAFAIAGHHAGIPDRSKLKSDLITANDQAEILWQRALADIPPLSEWFFDKGCLLGPLSIKDPLEFELHCRMLLSYLVDADRLNTAASAGEQLPESRPLLAADLLKKLLDKITEKAGKCAEGAVKAARQEVLASCLNAANSPGSMFSLTVPTGGGKTFASMAFALSRAAQQSNIRRIIVVVPFLSIIEQNAAAYRDALGDDTILEHHSAAFRQADDGETYDNPAHRVSFENWDAPIIVTTSVRFFECLFSNHPRDVRRLANIARSVVILDEIQTVPRRYVEATLSVMRGLAENWGTNFLFCTATQPAFERSDSPQGKDPRLPTGTLQEIIPDPPKLFAALRRVSTEWRTTPLSWAQIAQEVSDLLQVLVIVNTRTAAANLYSELRRYSTSAFHLSNNMCPVHRLLRLREIRERLSLGLPCLVVTTQLVEAGVDIDFPVVWRALAPLDSIAQAAGRCDREGRLTEQHGQPSGSLVVFEPQETSMPPDEYREGAEHTRVMREAGDVSWWQPSTIRRYFDLFYCNGEALDPDDIQGKRKSLSFATVADSVQWIKDESRPVLIPYDDEAKDLIQKMKFAGISLQRFRQAQKYTISLWPHQLVRAKAIGSVYELIPGVQLWACREGLYSDNLGIQYEGAGFSI